jgi:hypothetical protein
MKGRAFVTVAEELSRGTSEAHGRAAAIDLPSRQDDVQ